MHLWKKTGNGVVKPHFSTNVTSRYACFALLREESSLARAENVVAYLACNTTRFTIERSIKTRPSCWVIDLAKDEARAR